MCDDKFVSNEAFYTQKNIFIYSVASSPVLIMELVHKERYFNGGGHFTIEVFIKTNFEQTMEDHYCKFNAPGCSENKVPLSTLNSRTKTAKWQCYNIQESLSLLK